ncbi:MAG: hypothetical protein ACOYMA_19915, partial [Bacteroidia bacterium]
MSNRLETLLNNAKQQNPLLTESDVSVIISNKNLLVKKQSFFTLKNILIMSVVSAVIAGLWLGFYPSPTQNNNSILEPLQASSPAIKDSLAEKSPTEKLLASADNYRQPTTAIITEVPLQASSPAINMLLASADNYRQPTTASKQDAPLFEPFNSTPRFSETNMEDNRTYFDENGYLILTNEELAKLGIITDGNVLKYENVTDTFFNFKNDGIIQTHKTFFSLKVEKHGSRTTNHGYTKDTISIKNSVSFWASSLSIINFPIAINTTNKKDSSHQIIEFLNGFGYEKDFLKEMESKLVPIVVHLKSVPGKYSSDLKLIFWFKTEAKFYEALSNDVANAVVYKYGTSSESEYKKILYKYRSFTRKSIQKGFDSLTVARLQRNYIQLNDKQLKDLNITKKRYGFKLKSYQNIDNKTKILRLKVKNGNSYLYDNVNIWNLIKSKNSQYIVVAKTDIHIKQIHYLMQFSDSVPNSKQNEIASKYFRENVNKLIPIKVDSNYIIWFEPTEKLKEIINPNVNVFTNSKVNLLELNEESLAKLNIYSLLGKISFPMHSKGKNFTQTEIGKKGSSMNFDAISKEEYYNLPITERGDSMEFLLGGETFNSLMVYFKNQSQIKVAPTLVTSENGLNWHSHNLDSTDKKLSKEELAYLRKNDLNFRNFPVSVSNDIQNKTALMNIIKYYIPIQVKAKTNDTIEPFNLIMWYEPTEDFFSMLPTEIANQIRQEYKAISTNQPTLSCKYFEACQNVSGKINSYLVYPNPAEQTLNIEINLAEERNLEFIITDITGK